MATPSPFGTQTAGPGPQAPRPARRLCSSVRRVVANPPRPTPRSRAHLPPAILRGARHPSTLTCFDGPSGPHVFEAPFARLMQAPALFVIEVIVAGGKHVLDRHGPTTSPSGKSVGSSRTMRPLWTCEPRRGCIGEEPSSPSIDSAARKSNPGPAWPAANESARLSSGHRASLESIENAGRGFPTCFRPPPGSSGFRFPRARIPPSCSSPRLRFAVANVPRRPLPDLCYGRGVCARGCMSTMHVSGILGDVDVGLRWRIAGAPGSRAPALQEP